MYVLLILLYLLSIIFLILVANPKFTRDLISEFSFRINVFEFFLLLFLCLIYLYESFTEKILESRPLKITPSFFIIAGLFFYIMISLPLLLIGDKLFSFSHHLYYLMFSIHYFSISILFLCLAKAFTCKTPLTT